MTPSTLAERKPALPVSLLLASGFAFGLVGNILLRGQGGPGLNFFLLFLGLGLAVWALGRHAGLTLSREALVTLGVGIALAAALVLRGSEALRFFSFLAAALAFALPAFRAGAAWLQRSGVSDQIGAVVGAVANALLGSFRLIGRGVEWSSQGGPVTDSTAPTTVGRGRAWAVLRGLLLAIPFLFVFGALFMSADQVFAGLVTDLVHVDLEELTSHLFLTAVLTWLASGYLTGFLTGTRPIGLPDAFRLRPRVGIVEIGIALALVDLLFLLFVSVQFRYLFGGGSLVEITPGLTYAEYVREGFAQLALACTLVLPSLLAADWLLHRRQRRDDLVFRILGGLLLLLLLVIMASAFQRLLAYQAAYGLTESRFYGGVFLGWLALLTLGFAATVLRGRRERFAFPALLSGFAFVALLIAVNPDVQIARANLDRAADIHAATDASGKGVDARHLASLGADAVPTLLSALPGLPSQSRCVIALGLLERWGPGGTQESDWRSWNWAEARARALVDAEAKGLRAMVTGGAGSEACAVAG